MLIFVDEMCHILYELFQNDQQMIVRLVICGINPWNIMLSMKSLFFVGDNIEQINVIISH